MKEEILQNIKNRCKWRAKRRHNSCRENDWCYGRPITTEREVYLHIKGKSVATIPVYEDTLGQYTGYKDKNGTEIYDGDVVRFNYQHDECSINGVIPCCDCECRGVVTYSDEYKCLGISILESEHHYLEVNDFCFFYESDIMEDIEILGNIHDNPELLEKVERGDLIK